MTPCPFNPAAAVTSDGFARAEGLSRFRRKQEVIQDETPKRSGTT
jgi:hypothetical protein